MLLMIAQRTLELSASVLALFVIAATVLDLVGPMSIRLRIQDHRQTVRIFLLSAAFLSIGCFAMSIK